jgi:hypothetical protein
MKRLTAVFLVIFFSTTLVHAQEPVVQEGEFGVGIGAGHYFGDLKYESEVKSA